MKRLVGALLTAALFCAAILPALAADRIVIYSGQNPQSTQTNQQSRFNRIALGTWMRDALGTTTAAGGLYDGLSVVPGTGLNVISQPTTANQPGSLYQIASEDPLAVPSPSPNLAADTTQVVVQGLQTAASSQLGPLTAPGTAGQSVYYLIEAQVQTVDTTPLSIMFVSSTGSTYFNTVNTVRTDQLVYQVKAGIAGVSPSPPTVDSGWIGIANVLVANGQSSISGGNITMLPNFAGFLSSVGTGLTATGGSVSLAHGDYVDLTNTQTASGAKTFSSTLTDSNATAVAMSGTGANTITSNTTGANDAFILNATNAAQPTGNLVNLKANGVSKASVAMTGLVTSNAGFFASVGTAANNIQWNCYNASTICDFATNTAAVVNGVGGGILAVNNATNTTAGTFLTLDNLGNLGILGAAFVSGAAAIELGGPCATAHFQLCSNSSGDFVIPESAGRPVSITNAADTVVNAKFPDTGGLQVIGGASGTTLSYVPPTYTAAGAAVASTEHIVHGTWSCTSSTVTGNGGFFCSTTVTFSGAAAFASSTSYSCTSSYTNWSHTGTYTYSIAAVFPSFDTSISGPLPQITGATTVVFGGTVTASSWSASGAVTISGTYSCEGV